MSDRAGCRNDRNLLVLARARDNDNTCPGCPLKSRYYFNAGEKGMKAPSTL